MRHAFMLALGILLGLGTMAFTDILHPMTPFEPGSLVLDTKAPLPQTMAWVDQQYGFRTNKPTGVLEVRWYCVYEGMSGLAGSDVDRGHFTPSVEVARTPLPEGQDPQAYYYELTRVQTTPCPVFRHNEDYPQR